MSELAIRALMEKYLRAELIKIAEQEGVTYSERGTKRDIAVEIVEARELAAKDAADIADEVAEIETPEAELETDLDDEHSEAEFAEEAVIVDVIPDEPVEVETAPNGDLERTPVANTGRLAAGITAVAGAATLSPAGIGNAEYSVAGTIFIGGECMTFTRIADALTLTLRGSDLTTAAAHSADDAVQECLRYTSFEMGPLKVEAAPSEDSLETAIQALENLAAEVGPKVAARETLKTASAAFLAAGAVDGPERKARREAKAKLYALLA